MAEVKDKADGFFVDNGLLVRKWVACGEFSVGSPIFLIVVPAKFCIFFAAVPCAVRAYGS